MGASYGGGAGGPSGTLASGALASSAEAEEAIVPAACEPDCGSDFRPAAKFVMGESAANASAPALDGTLRGVTLSLSLRPLRRGVDLGSLTSVLLEALSFD